MKQALKEMLQGRTSSGGQQEGPPMAAPKAPPPVVRPKPGSVPPVVVVLSERPPVVFLNTQQIKQMFEQTKHPEQEGLCETGEMTVQIATEQESQPSSSSPSASKAKIPRGPDCRERPFRCCLCGSYFLRRYSLYEHRRDLHPQEPVFQCGQCDKAFTSRTELHAHLRLETHPTGPPAFVPEPPDLPKKPRCRDFSEKPFRCFACGTTFLRRYSLYEHRREYHPQESAFQCGQCNKVFMTNAEVHAHLELEDAHPKEPPVSEPDLGIAKTLRDNLLLCRDWMHLENRMIASILRAGYIDYRKRRILALEDSFLLISSYPKCCEGTFYLSAYQIDKYVYIRYIESGVYRGGLAQMQTLMSKVLPETEEGPLCSEVFSQEDIQKKQEHIKSKYRKVDRKDQRQFRPHQSYSKNLTTNKSSIKNSLNDLLEHTPPPTEAEVECKVLGRLLYPRDFHCTMLGTIVHTKNGLYQQASDRGKHVVKDKWYLQCSGLFEPLKLQLEGFFKEFPTYSCDAYEERSISSIVENKLPEHPTLREQCAAVSLIPNNWEGDREEFSHRFATFGICPRASRNKISWALCTVKHNTLFHDVCKELCNLPDSDYEQEMEMDQSVEDSNDDPASDQPPPPKKLAVPTPQLPLEVEPQPVPTSIPAPSSPIYNSYVEQLIKNGSLFLRSSTESRDLFAMNDYDSCSGDFMPDDYVHCSRVVSETGYQYVCECTIYNTLESMRDDPQIDTGDVNCVHTTFLRQERNYSDVTVTPIQILFRSARQYCGCPLVKVKTSKIKKFSAVEGDTWSFVHLWYSDYTNTNVVTCQSTLCKNSGTSQCQVSLLNDAPMCQHLRIFREHRRNWRKLLLPEQPSNVDEDVMKNEGDAFVLPIKGVGQIDFDVETGLYSCQCLSKHSASPEHSPALRAAIQQRNSITDLNPDSSPRVNGCLKGPDMIPPIPSDTCACGAGWTDSTNPGILECVRTMTLYTLQAPIFVTVYKRLCLSGQCVELWDEGSSQCLHVSTEDTCAGDELGWLFINGMFNSNQSFSAFCSSMNCTYTMTHVNSRPFMTPDIFAHWWVSWAINQKQDFRTACVTCKFKPRTLACHVTEVGVGFCWRDTAAIETPETGDMILVQQNKHTRCFIPYRDNVQDKDVQIVRENVCFISSFICGEISQAMDDQYVEHKANLALTGLPVEAQLAFSRMCSGDDLTLSERDALGQLFKILSSTAPVSSVLSLKHVAELERFINHVTGVQPVANSIYVQDLSRMQQYSPELKDLFVSAAPENNPRGAPHPDVIQLVVYLMQRVVSLHCNSIATEPALPQEASYNPPKLGRAYYFNPSGQKLRPIRKFSVDEESQDSREAPVESCRKAIHRAAQKGTSDLCLWFCPHCHCYGFHITKGAHTPKDPCTSLHSHLEDPPETVFCDFACTLQDYCLNRESGYYSDVRFFHDTFRGYTHNCPLMYNSSRLIGIEKVDQKRAEDFDEFVQRVLYQAKQMPKSHFMFFVQFFVNIWNELRAKEQNRRLHVALQGCL